MNVTKGHNINTGLEVHQILLIYVLAQLGTVNPLTFSIVACLSCIIMYSLCRKINFGSTLKERSLTQRTQW